MALPATLVLLSLLTACGSDPSPRPPPPPPDAGEAAAPRPSEAQGPEARRFLDELRLEEGERRAASRHATETARKLLAELRPEEALEQLRIALHHDPRNEEAMELLRETLFLLGDRQAEISSVARSLADEERVRREQRILEMQRLYAEGQRLMAEGKADEAQAVFDRLLRRLESGH